MTWFILQFFVDYNILTLKLIGKGALTEMSASKQKRSSSRATNLASSSRSTTAEYPILVEGSGDGTECSFKYGLYFMHAENGQSHDEFSTAEIRIIIIRNMQTSVPDCLCFHNRFSMFFVVIDN